MAHRQGRQHARCPQLGDADVGFELSDDEGETNGRVDTKAAVFALAERLRSTVERGSRGCGRASVQVRRLHLARKAENA
ncbi:DUF6461 domain-containing protein [Streptomyces sp. NBC_01549]|uniref:DUF6461 domain-containing protein n=1 Tax=Streptomyces sp. NBC_01549 TaxID=2975874 RepID=UPI00224E2FAA|nr:DUF6461 domain-containing protein [Streptomyces sp. NBC_01549]MCX4598815.1 DUF6461 domain-containing protein [Streptomyces sp. NBC_01549]